MGSHGTARKNHPVMPVMLGVSALVGMAIIGASLVSSPVTKPGVVWTSPESVPSLEKPVQPRPRATVTKRVPGPERIVKVTVITRPLPRVTVTLPRKTVAARPQPVPTVTKTVRPSPTPGPTVTVTVTVTAPATEATP